MFALIPWESFDVLIGSIF